MRTPVKALLVLAALTACPFASRAQGIDCARARTPAEKAICASPTLHALDGQVAAAYADAVARQPDRRDAMRTELLQWLRQRDAACNVPAAALGQCLSGQLTARLAALAPPASATALQPAAAVSQPDPALPPASDSPPAPAARLDAASLPAATEADTLLHVDSPGRFTIAARSPSGASLQLVDMLTGPSDVAGVPGAQDGRLDRLLDVGAYKLRVASAPGAAGTISLTVTPFHDAAPPAALPPPGRIVGAPLRDGEQRAFWLLVPPGDRANVRIEAAGRALADLRLWRDGRELTALEPARLRVDSTPAHPLDDLRLIGHVEPGTYLAIAYGGPALPWTDSGADQPFFLRAGASPALREGLATATMGPFGSEVFDLPPGVRYLRLELPAPAAADVRVGDVVGAIVKASREPSTVLTGPDGVSDVAEVRAAAGQAFTLRALDRSTAERFAKPGTWWIAASTTGQGGDELPPTLLLQQMAAQNEPLHIVASTAPRVGPTIAWRTRFNLRGPSSLLFQLPTGGDVRFDSTGVPIRHGRGRYGTLPADYYRMEMSPQTGALGSLEATIGAASVTPPFARPLPSDPVVPLGVYTLTAGQYLTLDAGTAPDATTGLIARRVPVALAEGPVIATIAAGETLSLPMLVARGGTLVVSEQGVGAIPFGQQDGPGAGRTTVLIPVADHPRTVAIGWRRTPAPLAAIPAPRPPGATPTIAAGAPAFLDLRRGEERGFTLTVPQGGLFRVETLGRLHTTGRLATPFIPALASGDANGAGQNMLIQSALRAGRYRVDVKAVDSAGHLGLLASPAPLLAGETLRPGGSVRATLPAGSGVAFPIEVADDDAYQIDVLSLGAPWTGRLEDADGWPVVAPGKLDGLAPKLRAGRYTLVVAPDAVGRQVVARLTQVAYPAPITGHGPHALPFEAAQTAIWREPEGADRPRTPDTWNFTLAGQAEVTLTLSDGMTAELRRAGDPAAKARIVRSWTGALEAGDWRLDATSLGRNDRLGYTVRLHSPDLQPGAPRNTTLPATASFSLARPGVATLASWGATPVKATLRREGGGVVGRYGARMDDWNVAASRLLPAGRYTLSLDSAAPPDLSRVDTPAADATETEADESDDQDAQTDATKTANAAPEAVPPTSVPDTVATTDQDSDALAKPAAPPAPKVTLTLALPPALPMQAAPATAAALEGEGVHALSLPIPAPGSLLVAGAAAASAAVLALERQDGDTWRTVALASGRSPAVAAPADGGATPWRVEAWMLDGGPGPIRLAARAVTAAGNAPGPVTLTALEGMPSPLAVAKVVFTGPGIASVGASPGLLAGGWAGHALTPASGSAVLDGGTAWLMGPAAATVQVTPLDMTPGAPVTLVLPPGLSARLPAPPAQEGRVALWLAESGSGQPSLGAGSGVAENGAIAMTAAPVTLRGSEGLRVRLTQVLPVLAAAQSVDSALQVALPPGTALPVTLQPGDKTLDLGLAPGVAAFPGWRGTAPVGVWGGAAPVSRTLAGDWTEVLLVNTGAIAAPARLTVQPAPVVAVLRPAAVVKRFFGAAGSFDLPFEAPAAARLVVTGDASLTALAGDAVARGTDLPVSGAGRVVVQHGAGPVALWLETPGAFPWPDPAAQPATLPSRVALTGDATALSFTADRPMLLHATTTSPVLAALQQAGRSDPPALFPAGAELHRAVAAGPVTLRLFSADDGPLGGTLALSAEPLLPLGEGLGAPASVAPGGSVAWAFTLVKRAKVGVGLRAEPDVAQARVLDAKGAVLGEGVAQLLDLQPGAYVLEARIPPASQPATLRPALVGITPRGDGPPPDVVQTYFELVGMKPGASQ